MAGKKKEGWIIPGWEKFAIVLGSGGTASMSQFVSTFLSTYLLMVGISPAIAATVLLIMKAWDALTDVFFGYIVDNHRFKPGKNAFTRWVFRGRYMPWFRILFPLLPIGTLVIFSISTALPLWARVTQYVLGYVLYDLGMTVSSAYNLVPLSITSNLDERSFVLSWKGMGQGFGALPVVFLGTVLVASSLGYEGAAMIFAILGIVLGLVPALFVRERNAEHADAEAKPEEHYTVKEMLGAIRRVPELLFLELGNLAYGLFFTSSYQLFLAYYIFGDANVSVMLALFGTIPTILLVPCLPVIFRHVDKTTVHRIACICFVVFGLAIYLPGPEFFRSNLMALYLLSLVQTTSYTMVMFTSSQALIDIVDIAKYRTHRDLGGIISAADSFISKVVNSLVSSISLLILGAYGFVSVEAGSFEELAALNAQGIGLQTEQALRGLWDVSYLYPMFGFALAGVFYFLLKIRRKQVAIYMKVNNGEMTREEGEKQLAALKTR